MPLVRVGTMIDGKVNWALVGHAGIMGLDHLMLGMNEKHYSNGGILQNRC